VTLTTASCATAPPPAPVPTDSGSIGTARADDLLANTVYSRLNADPTYYFRHVDVRVDNGVAYLSGYVWSTDALYAARRITAGIPGVQQVSTNGLELERNGRNSGVTR
jgi:osmotically-inducible protein OsmY